jgi:hypothetical protein
MRDDHREYRRSAPAVEVTIASSTSAGESVPATISALTSRGVWGPSASGTWWSAA